jgi:hypothetical protein
MLCFRPRLECLEFPIHADTHIEEFARVEKGIKPFLLLTHESTVTHREFLEPSEY